MILQQAYRGTLPNPSTSLLRPRLQCMAMVKTPESRAGQQAKGVLPKGVVWLDESAATHKRLYGQNFEFVLQRPKPWEAGPGLVRSGQASLSTKERAERQLTVRRPSSRSGPPVPREHGTSLWDVDITEYSFLGEAGLLPAGNHPFLLAGDTMSVSGPPANTDCVGIVPHPAFERPQQEDAPDKNPRRTMKVKFTCKLCNTTSVKRVSPHGWHSGSVFARCSNLECNVVHKLVDNLKLFHELKGSVFPQKPNSIKIPKGLPQQPGLDFHQNQFLYPMFGDEDATM